LHQTGAIQGFIFDLDGTLVDTEMLKAQAYLATARELIGPQVQQDKVFAIYSSLVGSTDEDVARELVDRLGLSDALSIEMGKLGTSEAWKALHTLRMRRYMHTTGTDASIVSAACSHNIALAQSAKSDGMIVSVATSSSTNEAIRILKALGIVDIFQTVIGRDQIKRPKPDPEIYLYAAESIGIAPNLALAVEDSPAGVTAAKAAGMPWIAVATQFTAGRLSEMSSEDLQWVVFDQKDLINRVAKRIAGTQS